MNEIIQQLVNALSLGGTYALLALGLAIVYSILGMINFAHGALMGIAGYVMLFATSALLPFPVVVLLAAAAAATAAVAVELIAYRPVRGAGPSALLLTSFAVTLILEIVFLNVISARPQAVPIPEWLRGTFAIGGFTLGVTQVMSIVLTVALLIGLNLFLSRTYTGLSVKAAADDFGTTKLMGISADAVIATAFALSGLLAGVAAVLWVAQRGSVDPAMGFLPTLKAFIAATIGGLGTLSGAVAGGFLLGAVEILLQAFLPSSLLPFRDAFALGIVILVLLLRPQGLLALRGAWVERA
jgi:branched-chain amino acid transport system permease protein